MESSGVGQPSSLVRRRRLTDGDLDENMMDTDIKDRYEAILNSIGTFINLIEGEVQPYLHPNLTKQGSSTIYDYLESLRLYRGPEDTKWMEWLGAHSTCNAVVVSIAIWRFLDSRIFSRYFPVGVEDGGANEWERLIGKAMEVIVQKEANKGESFAESRALRSALMTAIVNFPGTAVEKAESKKHLLGHLRRTLKPWIRREVLVRHEDMLRDKILHPAIELHLGMRCSQSDYDLRHATVNRATKPQAAENWNLRNIKTWISTKYSTIDGIFHELFPGLWREGSHETDKLELVKPVVIVYKLTLEQHEAMNSPVVEISRQSSPSRSETIPPSTTSTSASRGGDRTEKGLGWGSLNPFARRGSRASTASATADASSRPSKDSKDVPRRHRRHRSSRGDGIRTPPTTASYLRPGDPASSSQSREVSPSKLLVAGSISTITEHRQTDLKSEASDSDNTDGSSSESNDERSRIPPPKDFEPSWEKPAMASVPRVIR